MISDMYLDMNKCIYKGMRPSTLPLKTLSYHFSLNPPTNSTLKFLSFQLHSPGNLETPQWTVEF